ncbi:M23 family metallopeptidase [Oleispirillum naphthae]|uniref:M23 family metallopeptidase n=1 Tax=Oleispirillum naphthae TaxID=2838853 RepID=UPI00308265B1
MTRSVQVWVAVCGLAVLSGCSGPRLYSFLPSWPSSSSSSSSHAESRGAAATGGYTVRRGDTVYRIATSHGVPVRRFIEVNRLAPPYTLQVGQALTIPDRPTHTVRRGETVYRIAKIHNVDMSALVRVNAIREPYVIHIGQVLQLPGTTEPALDPPMPPVQAAAPQQAQEERPAAPQQAAAPPPRAAAIPTPPPRQGRGLDWPVRGKVAVPFGSVAKGMRNDGINISARLGTSVRAAEAGVVAYAGNELKGFGNMLLLKHSGGLITTYAHADEIKVQRGATVKRGQIIASVGQSGSVTSPQLHFEVREGSKAVDPMKFLN